MTPKEAVRKKCMECVGCSSSVTNCGGDKMIGQGDENSRCYFYPYRNGKRRPSVQRIRRFCLECTGGSYKLVADCRSFQCPVYEFRFGANPNRAGIGGNVSEKSEVERGVLV